MKSQFECETRRGVPSRLIYVDDALSGCLGQIDQRIELLANTVWSEQERNGISVTIEVNYKSQTYYLAVLIEPVADDELTYYCEQYDTYADCEDALDTMEHEVKTAREAYQWN